MAGDGDIDLQAEYVTLYIEYGYVDFLLWLCCSSLPEYSSCNYVRDDALRASHSYCRCRRHYHCHCECDDGGGCDRDGDGGDGDEFDISVVKLRKIVVKGGGEDYGGTGHGRACGNIDSLDSTNSFACYDGQRWGNQEEE
jgi:hypothetical protein